MTTTFIHHEADGLIDVIVKDHNHIYRKDDIVVLRQIYYQIIDCQYDIDDDMATYWLDCGLDEHPTAPN